MQIQVQQVIRPYKMPVETTGGAGPQRGGNWQTPRLGRGCFAREGDESEYVLCLSYNECDTAVIDGAIPYGDRDKLEIRQLRPGSIAIRLGDCEIWIDCSTGLEEYLKEVEEADLQ